MSFRQVLSGWFGNWRVVRVKSDASSNDAYDNHTEDPEIIVIESRDGTDSSPSLNQAAAESEAANRAAHDEEHTPTASSPFASSGINASADIGEVPPGNQPDETDQIPRPMPRKPRR